MHEAFAAYERVRHRLPPVQRSAACKQMPNLEAIADIAAAEDIWFHVDGAFGASLMLSDTLQPRLDGINRADSLAFDFHCIA